MGRLFLSRLGFGILFLILSNGAVAQDNYYVFKKSGQPFFNMNISLQRGGIFSTTDTLTLRKQDTVFLINRLGELFELKEPGAYAFSRLRSHRKLSSDDSFAKKYFSYVWKQFTNQQEIRQRPGVVYREKRNIELLSPMDSIRWYVPEIEFLWNNKTDAVTTYFHLQDLDSKHFTKIGTTSSSLVLYRDNVILKSGKNYRWTVSTEPFPDFNGVKFNSFQLLTRDAYVQLKQEIDTLIVALKLLGFSEKDIKKAICLDYKFCEF